MFILSTCIALLGLFVYLLCSTRKIKLESNGKCVIITGCDSGVGLSLAIFAQSLGFHVVATCLDTSSNGAQLIKDKYPSILILKMDVTNNDDVRETKELVSTYLRQTQSQLWGLVNNAGILIYGQFDWQTESQIQNQIQVNLIGVMRVTKAFLPLIRTAKGIPYHSIQYIQNWCSTLT